MLYTFAGMSVLRGELKVRFANSQARARQLSKLGDTDVNIVELPQAMDKVAAVQHLLGIGFAKDDQVRAALEAEVATVPNRVKREVKVRVPKAKAKAKVKKTKLPETVSTEIVVTEEEVDRLYNAIYGNQEPAA